MSSLQFEDEQVECYCFDQKPEINHSGLVPARTLRKNHESKKSERSAYSSDVKGGNKTQIVKTSLRREKTPTPQEPRSSWRVEHFQQPQHHLEQIFEKKQTRPPSNLPPQISYRPQQIVHQPIRMPQRPPFIRFQEHHQPVNQIKSNFSRYNPPHIQKIKFIPPPLPHIQPAFKKAYLSNSKISLSNLQKIEELPLHQISELKDRSSQKCFTPGREYQSPRHTSRQVSRKKSSPDSKNRISLTPREYMPNRLHLKEIQSVVDQNQRQDDQVSEVIGRGWEQREEDFSPACKEKLRTQTIGTSASHIKNSETANSVFGISESVMRWA